MKLALAMIVKGTDEEAKLLARCLSTLKDNVDGIFITRTHKKGEKPNEAVADVARAYGAQLSDYEWSNDFAAARNFNFSQVTPDYTHIMWSDADDMWRGADKLRSTIEEYPLVDAFGIIYLYDWDEYKKPIVVHWKTMVVKNDGCTTWVGRLHEDLEPQRNLDIRRIEEIERLHISSPERHQVNAQRNLEIAEADRKDNDHDPRTLWNLANSHMGVGDYQSATDIFERFIEETQSKDERYLAMLRIADIMRTTSSHKSAERYLQTAIGIQPFIPDAYYQLGYLYFSLNRMDDAEEYMLRGMHLKPMQHKMIVYNPRDYDYNPMMLLTQIYWKKNRPDLMLPLVEGCLKIYPDDDRLKNLLAEGEKERDALEKALKKAKKLMSITDKAKLRKELEKLPTDIKSHPEIVAIRNRNFIKEQSSGKDLVIYCGYTKDQWGPGFGPIGGSEEAVINLAREYAKLGWNVTVYNNCGHKAIEADAVTYRPFWEWNYRDNQDVTIIWRTPKPLDAPINCPKIFVDMHDVIPAAEFTKERISKVTKVFVKSAFHRSLFPNVPDDKIQIVPNGFVLDAKPVKKDRYLMINTSSPDRSLDVLPKLFKEVKKRVPKAKLQWAYGWELFENVHANDSKKLEWAKETKAAMRDAGIESLGKLSQEEVAKLYHKASVFAYPTEFAEISCISAIKAQAAGCYPVTTDFAALDETVTWGAKVHSTKTKDTWNRPYQFHFGLENEEAQQKWVDECVKALETTHSDYPNMDHLAWWQIALNWHRLFV